MESSTNVRVDDVVENGRCYRKLIFLDLNLIIYIYIYIFLRKIIYIYLVTSVCVYYFSHTAELEYKFALSKAEIRILYTQDSIVTLLFDHGCKTKKQQLLSHEIK